MTELSKAVDAMNRAAEGLRPYIQHTCAFNQVDTLDGDYCICNVNRAIKAANAALFELRRLARESEKQ